MFCSYYCLQTWEGFIFIIPLEDILPVFCWLGQTLSGVYTITWL